VDPIIFFIFFSGMILGMVLARFALVMVFKDAARRGLAIRMSGRRYKILRDL